MARKRRTNGARPQTTSLPPLPAPPEPPDPRRLVVCRTPTQFLTQVDPRHISELIKVPGQFVWFDVQDPQESDVALLQEEFGFHPLALEDATRHHERPKVDSYDGYYFLVFYALAFDKELGQLITQALSLFVGHNYLVSVHAGRMPVIEETIRRWQRQDGKVGRNVGSLLYALLDSIVDDYFPVMDQLAERVETIEETIFEQFRPTALQEIFALKRDLLNVRRVVAPERDVLNVLIRREVPIFDQASIVYLQDVYDHSLRITDTIDLYRDLLSSALDAFLSMQSNQLNQVVRALTVASIILMSCALVAGIYGMNFTYMPELSWTYGYPFALGLMALIAVGLIVFFRWRGWL